MFAIKSALVLILLAGHHYWTVAGKKDKPTTEKIQHKQDGPARSDRLSVLLLASFFTGHQLPLIALGEELVRRGHQVTMMGPITEGSSVLPDLPESVGIKFIPTGRVTQDSIRKLTRAAKNFTSLIHHLWNYNFTEDDGQGYLKIMWEHLNSMNGNEWDYVVADHAVNMISFCTDKKWGPKVMINSSPLPTIPSVHPPWPYPRAFSTATSNMSFMERLGGTLLHGPLEFIEFKAAVLYMNTQLANCSGPLSFFENFGIASPVLFNTVTGFDYAKLIYPLQHYVGPILTKSPPPFSNDLMSWLAGQKEASVVYISMGSIVELTPPQAQALLNGIMSGTNYSVVWALRESNRDCLEGLQLDNKRVIVSGWVSQVAMLQHKVTSIAILHCGLGGVQEALIHAVPVICVPYAWEQFSIAVRLVSQELGARILPDELTPKKVQESIQVVQREDIRKQVYKMSRILRMAGGAETAADLVEFYAAVGHDHGVPAFVRYKWSWVQYYNVDVWVVLLVLLGVVCWVCMRLCRYCLRSCMFLLFHFIKTKKQTNLPFYC